MSGTDNTPSPIGISGRGGLHEGCIQRTGGNSGVGDWQALKDQAQAQEESREGVALVFFRPVL